MCSDGRLNLPVILLTEYANIGFSGFSFKIYHSSGKRRNESYGHPILANWDLGGEFRRIPSEHITTDTPPLKMTHPSFSEI